LHFKQLDNADLVSLINLGLIEGCLEYLERMVFVCAYRHVCKRIAVAVVTVVAFVVVGIAVVVKYAGCDGGDGFGSIASVTPRHARVASAQVMPTPESQSLPRWHTWQATF